MANNNDHWVDERLDALDPGSEWQPNVTRGLARLRERRASGSTGGRRWTWGAAAATAASVCLMAFPAPRAVAQRCLSCTTALFQNFAKNEREGRIAPYFTLNDASGRPVTLSDFKGKVVLLNFWATWCGGCRVEIPWLCEFQQTYRDRGLVVLGVSFDEDGWTAVKPYIEAKKVNYRVMIGNDAISAMYGGVDALPTTLLIDRSGRIAATHVGLIGRANFQAGIERLLAQ